LDRTSRVIGSSISEEAFMKLVPRKNLLMALLAMLLALGACERNDQRTVGQKLDSALAKSEQLAARAKEDAQKTADSAREAVKNASQETKALGAAAMDNTGDATITSKVNAAFAADRDLSATRIDVDTKDGVVTLAGVASSATARERAAEIARNIKGVNSVNNQLTIKSS
jgi:hyperosmotically inducible periplasmic protein